MTKILREISTEYELPSFSFGQTIILMLLVSFATVGALAISPALPSVAKDLGLSKHSAQNIIVIYLAGFALGNLLYAPLANRHGRKPVMIAGLAVSACASLVGFISGYSGSYHVLIASRFVMALAASSCLKISYNIAADTLNRHHLTRMTSLFTIALAIAPPISIALGGCLTEFLTWEIIFLFLTLYAILLIVLTLFLPETLKEKVLHALKHKHIAQSYLQTLRGRFMITGPLLIGCTSAGLYLFGIEAPFISARYIGLSPPQFGLLFMLAYFGMFVGGVLGALLAHHVKMNVILFAGLVVFFASSIILLVFFLNDLINSWTLFIPSYFIFFGISLIFTCGVSITMNHATDKSYGSSLMNFINLTFATLVVILVKPALIHVLAYSVLLIALAIFSILLAIVIKLKNRAL